jgi:hypothetical protein
MLRIIPRKWRRDADADPVSRSRWWRPRGHTTDVDLTIGTGVNGRSTGAATMPALPPASAGMAYALNRTAKHVYAGTVPAAVVRRRHAANRVARMSRRANRGR